MTTKTQQQLHAVALSMSEWEILSVRDLRSPALIAPVLPLFQVEVTGAAGTTGVSAAKRATPAGSAASGCARAPVYRDTPAMAPEKRSAPATRRSVPVSDSFFFFFF